MLTTLPLFYFKPTICWIDDDPLFLQAITLSYPEDYKYLIFNTPEKALDFFSSYQSPLAKINFTRGYTECDVFGTNDHFPVDLNISTIAKLATLPERFNEVTVLIVDYSMPNMNGLAVCEKLKNLPCKKVLLTGEASHRHAVTAFNQGLIDKFIKKNVAITHQLQKYIKDLNYLYFSKKTENLVSHIESLRRSPLSDPVFINFFYNWCQKNTIKEFYLINTQGSFLVKNSGGVSSYFIVMSERDKAEFLELNDEIFDKVEKSRLELIKAKEKTAEEIEKYITQIAFSGATEFIDKYKDKSPEAGAIIGHFGLGFYSAFMVAKKIIVESRSAHGAPAYKWTSLGDGSYTLEESAKETRGTLIEIHLKEEEKEFIEDWRIRGIVKKYSDYVTYPIFLIETKEDGQIRSEEAHV